MELKLIKDQTTLEPPSKLAEEIVEALKEQGILFSTESPFHSVLKIKPLLVITEENAIRMV